jgi:hypothetical protein
MASSGPFTKRTNSVQPPTWGGYKAPDKVLHRQWYRQQKNRKSPLPFNYSYMEVTQNVVVGNAGQGYIPLDNVVGTQLKEEAVGLAINKAYSKFVDQMSSQSQWANNLHERQKTFAGAVDRLTQLARFTRAVRRFDVKAASDALRVNKRPRVDKKTQSSGLWLEYHFGWEPLVKDIGNAMETLNRDFSEKRIKAGARNHERQLVITRNGVNFESSSLDIATGVRMGGTVRIVNPNTSLLADLGFINPASVLWEAVPFSFVVDWFANVGQVIASYSDFAGKSVSDAYTTAFQERTWSSSSGGYDPYGNEPYWSSGFWSSVQGAKAVSVQRGLGITGPTFRVKPFKGFSVTRGATAVALLLQQLARLK